MNDTIVSCCPTAVSSSGSMDAENIAGRDIGLFNWAIAIIKLIIAVFLRPVPSVLRVPHFSDFYRQYEARSLHVIRSTVRHRRLKKIDGSYFITIYILIF